MSRNLLEIWRLFFTFLTMLTYEAKASICSAIKENLILYCHKFAALAVAVINKNILIARSVSQRTPLEKEIVNFAVGPLVSKHSL